MSRAPLFLIPFLVTTGLSGGTLNTVYCFLDAINGNPSQSLTVSGVSSASCSLTDAGDSQASSTTDDNGDFSVSAYSNEGFRDARQATTATGTWTVPVEETITWQISFDNLGATGNESFTGVPFGNAFDGQFDYTATFQAGFTITAFAQGDGDGGDGSLTATVISMSPVPEPTALILVTSGAFVLVIRQFMKRNQIQRGPSECRH